MDREKLAEFDRAVGLTGTPTDDPALPDHLQGVAPPSWWLAASDGTDLRATAGRS